MPRIWDFYLGVSCPGFRTLTGLAQDLVAPWRIPQFGNPSVRRAGENRLIWRMWAWSHGCQELFPRFPLTTHRRVADTHVMNAANIQPGMIVRFVPPGRVNRTTVEIDRVTRVDIGGSVRVNVAGHRRTADRKRIVESLHITTVVELIKE